MNVIEKLKENIKKWLRLEKAENYEITIHEALSRKNNQIKNTIWTRGQAYEIEQLFRNIYDYDPTSFWGNVSNSEKVRKIHAGTPALIVNTLANIVINDINSITVNNDKLNDVWSDIKKDNNFNNLLSQSLKTTLTQGDGAFKITYNSKISKYPLIEYYEGLKCDYKYSYGRLTEILFRTEIIDENKKEYVLLETYGKGYIRYELSDTNGNKLELNELEQTRNLKDVMFIKNEQYDEQGNPILNDIMLAVPFIVWESDLYKGRGKSILDGKDQAFDFLDETISQWADALRKGRTKVYMPIDLIPKDAEGNLKIKSDFINSFITISGGRLQGEGYNPKIDVVQPEINTIAYDSTYSTALELAFQGIISPSTLGIDLKKTDNAESQREKEKTTLYTRNAIITALESVLSELVKIALQSYYLQQEEDLEDIEVSIVFGEYTSPGFEAVITAMAMAKTAKIISNELLVEELWGDTKTDEEKAEEVDRLNEADNAGMDQTTEPNFMQNVPANQDPNLDPNLDQEQDPLKINLQK